MIPKPQFLSYFQAKTGEVGLRLLDWTNILPHLSVCGAMYLTGTVPVPLETRSIVVVVIVAGIVVAAIVGGILWMRPPPVAVDVDLVGGLVFGGVFAPANFRLLIAL